MRSGMRSTRDDETHFWGQSSRLLTGRGNIYLGFSVSYRELKLIYQLLIHLNLHLFYFFLAA